MKLDDFSFDLPEELIAQFPLPQRASSRLLCLNATSGAILHKQFCDLPNLLHEDDLLVFNNTRVIPARFCGHKPTGGKVEIVIERILQQETILAQLGSNKKVKLGMKIMLESTENIFFQVIQRENDFFILRCNYPLAKVLPRFGQVPLPPYITRAPSVIDQERYQTVYAEVDGAVAAPTAGLHFDQNLLADLAARKIDFSYITLHVGAGTYQPVRVQEIMEHRMHSEYVEVSRATCAAIAKTQQRGGRVIAVGTTSARALETAAAATVLATSATSTTTTGNRGEICPFVGDTNIFIYPGFKFKCVDGLITNFHLPKSTLLMLVSALAGLNNIKNAYQKAIEMQYRFFSYGDAMFIASLL